MLRSWRRGGEGGPRAPGRVVLVDDDPFIIDLFQSMLSVDDAYEVVGTAGDGAEAIEVCREAQPDTIVLDLWMPVMGGLDALPELRRVCPSAGIVVVSARHSEAEALAAGADLFVLKPEAARNLSDVLARVPISPPR